MENPNSWTEVTRVIDRAIQDWQAQQKQNMCGLSLPMYIQKVLEHNGYTFEKK